MDARIYSQKMIDRLKRLVDKCSGKFITYPKFIFLCGKAYNSEKEYLTTNRGITEKFIQSKSDTVFIVLSEKLWENSFGSDIDLLTFEEFLAEVSDDIILFVESPGSFCELGAFAYADDLFGSRLTIVIDSKRKNDDSFIIKGPTKKAQKGGANVIFAPLEGNGLLASNDLRLHISEKIKELNSKKAISNKKYPNTEKDKVLIYTFILEILELIKILQPINKKDLLDVYKAVKDFDSFNFVKSDKTKFHSVIKPDYIYKLLSTVGLIEYDGTVIRMNKEIKPQGLMFRLQGYNDNRERNRLICRKFKYGGQI